MNKGPEKVKFSKKVEKVKFDRKTPETVVFSKNRPIPEKKQMSRKQIEEITEEVFQEKLEDVITREQVIKMLDRQSKKLIGDMNFEVERVAGGLLIKTKGKEYMIDRYVGSRGGNVQEGATTFVALTDTPAGYLGSQLRFVRVKADGTGLEFVDLVVDRFKTTSSTSQAIASSGSKTFTVEAGLAYIAMQDVIIVNDATHFMHGTITSYNSTTGEMVVSIQDATGTGTFSSWSINLDGINVSSDFSAITGDPYDNTALGLALDDKQDAISVTDKQIIYSDGGTPSGDSALIWDKTKNAIGVQVADPLTAGHFASNTGATTSDVVTGSIGLIDEVAVNTPTASGVAIAEPPAGSGGGLGYTNGGSGNFYANNTTYYFRIYPCLVDGSTYYRSQFYEAQSGADPNDGQYYDISLNWGTVSISGETVDYFVEYSTDDSSYYPLGVFSGSGTTFTSLSGGDPTTPWGSFYTSTGGGTAPDAPVSFDSLYEDTMYSSFYENGTYYQYELDTYKNISGTNYVSGAPVSYSAYDNNMGSYFAWQMSWTLTGSYDGVILRRSTDGGMSWQYQNLGSTSSYIDQAFSDDGSGTMWGNTYGGGGGSTDFDFDMRGRGTAPSGNSIFSPTADQYTVTIPDSQRYIIKHTYSGVVNAKILAPTGAISYGKNISSSYYDTGYTSWGDGSAQTPSSYGFTGTNQNRDYKAYGWNGSIYSVVPLTLSVVTISGSKYVSGSVTYPSGITQIKILRQVNGGGYTVSKTLATPTTSFTDDATDGAWNGNTTVIPNSVIPSTLRLDREITSVASKTPFQLQLIANGSGTRYAGVSFGVATTPADTATLQSHIYHESTTGYLNTITGRIQLSASIGATPIVMLGNTNVINNGSSSTIHFQVKGQNDAGLINTRSDQDTVGFGATLGSDEQTAVVVQPARSSDMGIVMKGHSSQSTTSNIIRFQSSAGSYYGYITVGAHFVATTGSASTPGHTFYNDTNNGFFAPTADTHAGSTGGTERWRVDSSGRFGVGNTTLTAYIDAPASTASIASFRIRAGTAPSSPNEGDMWTDSTKKTLMMRQDGLNQAVVGLTYVQTADKTVTNTVTETSIIGTGVGTVTLPANFWVAGKTIRLRIGGVYSTPAFATPSVTVKVKYGSTVIATVLTTALLSGATNLEFDGEVLITCRTVGGSGTVITHGDIEYATGVAGTIAVDPLNNAGATTTINTTTSNALDVTVAWDTATTSRIVKSTVCTIEVLN